MVDIQIDKNITPQFKGLMWQLKRSLSHISKIDTEGISKIIVRSRYPYDEKINENAETIFGYYFPAIDQGEPAHIEIYIEPFFSTLPMIFWWSSVPVILITRTLAHEVGHHLDFKQGVPNLTDNVRLDLEESANHYSDNVLFKMKSKWNYKLGFWLMKELGFWHYTQGILDYREQNYTLAIKHFYLAWKFDPTIPDLSAKYWKCKELQSSSSTANDLG